MKPDSFSLAERRAWELVRYHGWDPLDVVDALVVGLSQHPEMNLQCHCGKRAHSRGMCLKHYGAWYEKHRRRPRDWKDEWAKRRARAAERRSKATEAQT